MHSYQKFLSKFYTFVQLIFVALVDFRSFRTILRVRQQRLSYLGLRALIDLFFASRKISQNKVPGIFVEAGCALGGSAIILTAAKDPRRPFMIYDTFERIPPPSDQDGPDAKDRYQKIADGKSEGIDGNLYYGYMQDLDQKVAQTFSGFSLPIQENAVELVKGLFQDTMHIDAPVSLAHIDCDWYDSVWTSLCQIEPHLSAGGILIIDDYADWSGCKKAVDQYFRDKKESYLFLQKSRLHILKKA